MGRKLEWELTGKSDVPQKMAQAKASMEGLEGASNALSKKFREAFKDIAVGFLAPMVLIQKTIGFISDKFAEAKQYMQESRDFAKEAQNAKYFTTGGREAVLQAEERDKESKGRLKGMVGSFLGYRAFLQQDPRGMDIMREGMKEKGLGLGGVSIPGSPTLDLATRLIGSVADTAQVSNRLATDPAVRAKIDAILASDAAKRAAGEANANAPTAQKINEISGNVIGVGMSPQLAAMKEQTELQSDMANSLRALVERDQVARGFRTQKGEYDLGSPASGGRTTIPR